MSTNICNVVFVVVAMDMCYVHVQTYRCEITASYFPIKCRYMYLMVFVRLSYILVQTVIGMILIHVFVHFFSNSRTECEVMEKLLMADIAMSKWDYVESLLHLQNAHTKISQLMNSSSSLSSNRIVKLSFLGMKTPSMPVLYTWLKQYKEAIYSKVILALCTFIYLLYVEEHSLSV